jgi:XTP/dITP diphosphohydrolase
MLPKLIFASHNPNKTREIANLLNGTMLVQSLNDIGFTKEIIEDGLTLHENAHIKSSTIYQLTGLNCFADDTGLMVESLGGEPGVFSARYAGEEKDTSKNNQKLLSNLTNVANRNAKFVTVISLYLQGTEYFFEGILNGTITHQLIGEQGFGYDPLFMPIGSNRTLAQMSLDEKNKISHRKIAFKKMADFFLNLK